MSGADLPKGWTLTNIESACSKITDGSHNPPKASSEGLPMLSAKNVHNGIIDFNLDHRLIPDEAFALEDKRTDIQPGDILLTTVGALGRTAVVKKSLPKFTLQRSVSVLSVPGINAQCFRYSLEEHQFQRQITENAKGTAQKGIYLKKLRELTVPLPPLAEQKVIAKKLDTLLAQVETTKAHLERIPKILKTFRQSILAAAVSGKLTEEWRNKNPDKILDFDDFTDMLIESNKIRSKTDKNRIDAVKKSEWFYDKSNDMPVGWVQANLIEVTSLITCGVAKKPDYVETGIPFLSAQNSKPFSPNLNKIKYISESDFKIFTVGGKPEKGDVLYSRVGANFGEACVIPWDFEFAIYVSLTLIKPLDRFLDGGYLTIFLNSIDGVLQSRGGIMGSGIQNLNVESVRKYKIPLPSLCEQTQIISRVEELFTFADNIEQKANTALERVNNLTQSILAKAFRGELTEQWRAENQDLITGENSAEALLEKIKAEREAMVPKKKTRTKKRA